MTGLHLDLIRRVEASANLVTYILTSVSSLAIDIMEFQARVFRSRSATLGEAAVERTEPLCML